MNSRARREQGIDALKGLCILLVVLCHTLHFHNLTPFLQRVSEGIFLNCFFLVSGYLSYKTETKAKAFYYARIRSKFRSLFLTYVVCSCIAILWHLIIAVCLNLDSVSATYTGWTLIKRDLFFAFSGLGIDTLWFLPVLFLSYAFLHLYLCATRKINRIFRHIFLVFLALLFIVLGHHMLALDNSKFTHASKIGHAYLRELHRIFYGTGYTFLGYTIHSVLQIFIKKNRGIFAFLLGISISFCGSISAYYWGLSRIIFYIFISTFFLLFFLGIFHTKASKVLGKLLYPLIFCGENSLAIMIYHYQVFYPIEQPFFSGWLFFAVNLCSTLAAIILLRKLPISHLTVQVKKD